MIYIILNIYINLYYIYIFICMYSFTSLSFCSLLPLYNIEFYASTDFAFTTHLKTSNWFFLPKISKERKGKERKDCIGEGIN